MKKAVLFVLAREEERALQKLKSLGVMHVDAVKKESAPLGELTADKTVLERALQALESVKAKKVRRADAGAAGVAESLARAREVVAAREELDAAGEEERKLAEELARLEPWGDFDPRSLEELRAAGVRVGLYELSKKDLAAIPEGLTASVVTRRRGLSYTLIASYGEDIDLPFKQAKLPETSAGALEKKLAAARERAKQLEDDIAARSVHRAGIEKALRRRNEDIEFEEVRLTFRAEPEILYLSGFVPAPDAAALQAEARAEGWGVVLSDPEPGDDVPTCIRRPKPLRIIKPVFDFMGIVPGYREYDVSLVFLAFFSVFFAMLIGDAGYGLLFILFSLLGRFVLKKIPRELFGLLLLTGGATVVWGAITGTWFSTASFARAPILKDLVIEPIATFSKTDNQALMMLICFSIGVVHLSLAHLASIIRHRWTFRMISEIGRLAVLWGVYFFALNLVLMLPLNPAAPSLALGGFGLVLVFEQQQPASGRGAAKAILAFLKGFGLGLANILLTVLSVVSALADVISYVRLFAVGLAGVKIAETFNGMAAAVGGGGGGGGGAGVVGMIFAAFILVIGHALNMGLSLISVLVHGVRLNLLEFSGHLGLEWSGRLYKPFAFRGEEGN
jgi:V/A-type H+-transporting ATPase subunit I